MKSNLIFCALAIAWLAGCTPKSENSSVEIPAAVKESFNKLFQNATNVKWSKENDTEYEAEFSMGGTNKASNFDQSGKWLVTETEVSVSNLPAAIQTTISNEFASYSIEEAEMVETADGNTFYEIEMESGEVTIEAEISADGKVMKKKEVKEEEEKE